MADDKKVMDVALPTDAKVDIGSKPMIVGHRQMAQDPMFTGTPKETPELADAKEQPPLAEPAKKKVISPLNEKNNLAEANVESSGVADKSKLSNEEKSSSPVIADVQVAKPPENLQESSDSQKASNTDGSAKEKVAELDPEALAMEQDDEVQKLVESKKYFVKVHQSSGSHKAPKLFLAILLLLGLLGGLFYAVDTKKLDLGIELPFSIFGSEEQSTETDSEQSNKIVPVTEQEVQETTPVVTDPSKFELPDFKFSMNRLSEWSYVDKSGYDQDTPVTVGFEITTDTGDLLTAYTVTGKGGDCEPAEDDEPHADGNTCNTYEELGKTETESGSLVKVKFSGKTTVEGGMETTYGYCFRPLRSSSGNTLEDDVIDVYMGFALMCESEEIFFDFKLKDPALGTDSEDLNKSEAFFDDPRVMKIAEQLLTITFN